MTTPRRSRNWVWFFGVLAGLTVTAIGIEVWYNLRQQLRPGALAAARQRWRDQGPSSYQAQYLVKRHDGSEQRYVVVVEEGKVASVRKSTGQALEPGAYPFDRVESLFDHIEEQLREDGRPDAPRVYASAVFDPKDGHVLRYIRSLRSPRERLEVNVLLRPVEEKRTLKLVPGSLSFLCIVKRGRWSSGTELHVAHDVLSPEGAAVNSPGREPRESGRREPPAPKG